MTTRPITASVLGPQAEALLRRDVEQLGGLLERLDVGRWSTMTDVGGAPVTQVVQHLADGADRFAEAIERHYEDSEPGPLLQPFDDPDRPPVTETPADDPGAVDRHYRTSTERLAHALGTTRQTDWSWPVWSPVGGLETLAEATRRWLAHHFVHRDDLLRALGADQDLHDDTTRLVVEFVLDAVARRADHVGDALTRVEVVTSLPGAGSWTLVLGSSDEPEERRDLWSRFGEIQTESLPDHRVERGPSGRARVHVTGAGAQVWRAGFGRGATWSDLEAHGDDEAREQWARFVAAMAPARPGEVGPIQS